MSKAQPSRSKTVLIAVLLGIFLAVVLLAGIWLAGRHKSEPVITDVPEKVAIPVSSSPIVDYNALGKDSGLTELMEQRKSRYGVQDGVDIIVKPEETVRIGDKTVSMAEILETIRLHRGEIVEKDIQDGHTSAGDDSTEYGMHIVKPGENIWEIHFQLLKEFFLNKQISIHRLADEPDNRGYSSGVGKILKFSENMVYIYNIDEGRIDFDMHNIQPLNKIVIYNMESVFSLLEYIDPDHIDRIHFDGKNLWMPAKPE